VNGYYWKLKVGHKYDPNQPRIPAGDPRGGQWTAEGGGQPPTERNEDMWTSVLKLRHLKEGLDVRDVMYASQTDRGWVKMDIVDDLAERTGLDKWAIDDTIKNWSKSSSDYHLGSLEMQQAIADEFGLDFRRLEDRLKLARAEQKEFIQDPMEGYTLQSFDQGRLAPSPLEEADRRKLARAIYEHTQERLAAVGFEPGDMLRLRRGATQPKYRVSEWGWKEGDVVRVESNPVSSWTGDTSAEISSRFARHGGPKKTGFILEMEVPIESIFSTARTGFGCLTELEFIVFDGDHEAKVVRLYE
jgi:hypothetical protein